MSKFAIAIVVAVLTIAAALAWNWRGRHHVKDTHLSVASEAAEPVAARPGAAEAETNAAASAMLKRRQHRSAGAGQSMAEHAVIVTFSYAATSKEPLFFLEDRLQEAIEAAGVGEFDGSELALDLSDGTLYMYGPDAEALFQVVPPLLAEAACFRTAAATLRFGPPDDGVPERTVMLRP